MEMTFPHKAMRQDSVASRNDYRTMIAAVIARQANSRTVRAVRQAEIAGSVTGSESENRMHYFAGHLGQKMAVRGAFWRSDAVQPNAEPGVYHAGLANRKDPGLYGQATGDTLTLAGQGILRNT